MTDTRQHSAAGAHRDVTTIVEASPFTFKTWYHFADGGVGSSNPQRHLWTARASPSRSRAGRSSRAKSNDRESHRSAELWVVVSGAGHVVVDDTEFELTAGESVLIPSGSTHQLTNHGDTTVRAYSLYWLPEHKPA